MQLGSRIDFAARRHWPATGVVLAMLAAAVAAWQGWSVAEEVNLFQRQRRGLAALERRPGPLMPAMSAEDIKRHANIDALARYLATPWARLLALFEERAPSGVVLIRFEPDAVTGRIELTGRAPTTKALANYVIALERDPRLAGVLLHHHEALRDGANAGVEFTIGAAWGGSESVPAAVPAASATSAVTQAVALTAARALEPRR
jgi:hypothetical protein